MALKNTQQDNTFLTILADGTIRMSVPEFTEGAVTRDYETSDGKTGTKHELVYTELSGIISKVAFYEGSFGKSLQLTVTDEGADYVLSLPTASNFGEDMMKKLLSVDITQPVRIVPYAFVDDKGKNKKGITLYQNDVKVKNYFQEGEGKDSVRLHGYPEVPAGHGKKAPTTDDWKLHFMSARVFMINFITEKLALDVKVKEEDWSPDTKAADGHEM